MKGAAALNVSWPDPNARPRRFGGGRGEPREAPKTYAERVQELKNYFAEARAYRDAVKAGQVLHTDSRYAAMMPALDREIPVIVEADERFDTALLPQSVEWRIREYPPAVVCIAEKTA